MLLPGDGVGPEVAAEARLVLGVLAPDVEVDERPLGAINFGSECPVAGWE